MAEHNTARFHVADTVHTGLDLKLTDTLRRGLHRVPRLVRRILLELGWEACARVHNRDVFEDDIVIGLQINVDYGTFVTDKVDLLLNITLTHNDTRFGDGLLTGVDALDEVDCREWLYIIESFL